MLTRRSKVVVSSLMELEDDAFEVVNGRPTYGSTAGIAQNDVVSTTSKIGVLGGSVATLKGDYLVGQCTQLLRPIGLFSGDAIPDNFMNAPAVASNKIGVAKAGGEYEVDVFETHYWVTYASMWSHYAVLHAL